ncbi:RNA-binding cell elongation regulator Jag/EloR [Texcoconibacillus texcoconensis]|uniref:RNA-binding protein KhpB n=1 Tax=Texcoconibacillus texcoconensis TaxID=1095777 RepID=A0A840QU08_9BACI|nr:spoIIIJ-associated protein [Texcoconibacillus texcoconensis]
MKNVTVSGKTIEEAVDAGLDKLEVEKENVNIKVIEEPQKGFLGLIGNRPAIVELTLKPDPCQEALNFLRDTIDKMGVEVSIEKEEVKDGFVFQITGEQIGILIGKRGQTLDSLQYLVNLVANRYANEYIRITLDAEGYRERRKQALEQLAERIRNKVLRMKKEVRLEPMSAQERKVIHTTLQKDGDVKTFSSGEEPNRRIVVAPK